MKLRRDILKYCFIKSSVGKAGQGFKKEEGQEHSALFDKIRALVSEVERSFLIFFRTTAPALVIKRNLTKFSLKEYVP